jgi:hypothetical protein
MRLALGTRGGPAGSRELAPGHKFVGEGPRDPEHLARLGHCVDEGALRVLGVCGKRSSWTPLSVVDVHSDVHKSVHTSQFLEILGPQQPGQSRSAKPRRRHVGAVPLRPGAPARSQWARPAPQGRPTCASSPLRRIPCSAPEGSMPAGRRRFALPVRLLLLSSSNRSGDVGDRDVASRQNPEDLPSDVALEAAHDFALGESFGRASGHVVLGGLM